ncbi:methyltransferase domain-containing protein [Euzebya sp.]|uniref:methyltransferase domain-containing protein n=1 Tax=Euzebya sp. TaxID=1971409 RepID=UPI0035158F8A
MASLRLAAGDTVVDLGTGTGRNLRVLAGAVGPTGRVVGVDLSRGDARSCPSAGRPCGCARRGTRHR